MLQVKNINVFNFEGAIRGMRQPYKTTDKSDSLFGIAPLNEFEQMLDEYLQADVGTYKHDHLEELTEWYYQNSIIKREEYSTGETINYAIIGEKDLALMKKLARAGSPHNKFMRQIGICMDIRTTKYLWSELDTYKVGTVADSESTMHTITNRPFVLQDFSSDGSFYDNPELTTKSPLAKDCLTLLKQDLILLNTLRDYYSKEEDKERKQMIWRTIIQKLPNAYIQERTWTANYSILKEIVTQRTGHKLSEWKEFIDALKNLPYADELIFINKGDK